MNPVYLVYLVQHMYLGIQEVLVLLMNLGIQEGFVLLMVVIPALGYAVSRIKAFIRGEI